MNRSTRGEVWTQMPRLLTGFCPEIILGGEKITENKEDQALMLSRLNLVLGVVRLIVELLR